MKKEQFENALEELEALLDILNKMKERTTILKEKFSSSPQDIKVLEEIASHQENMKMLKEQFDFLYEEVVKVEKENKKKK